MRPTPASCVGPNRRDVFRFGSVAVAGAAAGISPFTLKAAEPDRTTNDPAVIFIWLPGGPPHQDTFDMKPDAPVEYRGEFNPIRTNVPGIDICEHLPLLSKVADKFALIRSIAHTFADHGGGHKKFLTGRDPQQPTGFVNDYPMAGSMASKLIGGTASTACPVTSAAWTAAGSRHRHVQLRQRVPRGRARTRSWSSATRPNRSSASSNLSPLSAGNEEQRCRDRNRCWRRSTSRCPHEPTGLAAGMDQARGKAFDLVTSGHRGEAGVRPEQGRPEDCATVRRPPLRPAVRCSPGGWWRRASRG